MPPTGRRYPKDEFARRGRELYNQLVLPQLKRADKGKFVAIDIETGDFEMAESILAACRQLRARRSDPQPWVERVGYPYVYRFGGHGMGRYPHEGRGSQQ